MTREQRLEAALRQSMTAIDDWLNVSFPEHCDPERVGAARQRVLQHGTVAYIADVQETNRKALE
jgi:hypothetical protein